MARAAPSVYENYPEQPYISPDRNVGAWSKEPELFPYGVVERKQMHRLAEGILPGHVVMLWRIGFGNFTNKAIIPQYFEYRYGVDSRECIQTLINMGYVEICGAKDSLQSLNMLSLRKILKRNSLETTGKKAVLVGRLLNCVPEERLAQHFSLRRYALTSQGRDVLAKYDDIVQKHGPKK